MSELLKLLESDWDETRSFGSSLIKDMSLDMAVIIRICDSNRLDVQKFGPGRQGGKS